MKRLLLTLSCIISVIWLMPCFVHASYTAPDGNEYEYKIRSINYGSNWYYTVYSNQKICFCEQRMDGSDFFPIGYFNYNDTDTCGMIQATEWSNRQGAINIFYPSTYGVQNGADYYCFFRDTDSSSNSSFACSTVQNPDIPVYHTYAECLEYLTTPDVDFDNLYYDPTIPTPEFVVTMERPTPWDSIDTDTNFFDVTWNEYGGYYVQIGYKFSYPNGMKVGLVDGQVTYTPLTYANSIYFDVCSLEDMQTADNLNIFGSVDFSPASLPIQESESWQTSVPIWANNFNNSAYASARNKWNTKMRYCWPLYGNRLEIFERLFYVADGACYVGAWKHWNNSYPSDYQEEIPNNYQVGSAMPGYSNISNNTEYQEQTNTETSIGTQTGVNTNPAVIVNNLTPNYPDYPTVATYNHDNIPNITWNPC